MENINFDLVRASKMLSIISSDIIKLFLSDGRFILKRYSKDSIIHLEDELCDKIEIILQGKVGIDSLDAAGNLFSITDFFKDDILGGNLIFASNSFYPMTITSLTDIVVMQISKQVLFELFEINQLFLIAFMRMISDNAQILSRKIKHSINKSIREKILIYLTRQKQMQKSDKIKLNVSKTKLAEKMGVQRTSLSRELAKMKEEGLIDFNRGEIIIIKELDNKDKKV